MEDESYESRCINCGHYHTKVVSTGEYLDCPAIIEYPGPEDRGVYTSCPCKVYAGSEEEDG
jgi:hypothetical protein